MHFCSGEIQDDSWGLINWQLIRKKMSLAANSDLFNPLVPKAHNNVCQNLLFPLQTKRVKVS